MVFDPALFNRPVMIDEWKNRMLFEINDVKPKVESLYYGSRFQYWWRTEEGYKQAWEQFDLDNMKWALGRFKGLAAQDTAKAVENTRAAQ
jgi:hypothetical protein